MIENNDSNKAIQELKNKVRTFEEKENEEYEKIGKFKIWKNSIVNWFIQLNFLVKLLVLVIVETVVISLLFILSYVNFDGRIYKHQQLINDRAIANFIEENKGKPSFTFSEDYDVFILRRGNPKDYRKFKPLYKDPLEFTLNPQPIYYRYYVPNRTVYKGMDEKVILFHKKDNIISFTANDYIYRNKFLEDANIQEYKEINNTFNAWATYQYNFLETPQINAHTRVIWEKLKDDLIPGTNVIKPSRIMDYAMYPNKVDTSTINPKIEGKMMPPFFTTLKRQNIPMDKAEELFFKKNYIKGKVLPFCKTRLLRAYVRMDGLKKYSDEIPDYVKIKVNPFSLARKSEYDKNEYEKIRINKPYLYQTSDYEQLMKENSRIKELERQELQKYIDFNNGK